MNETDAARNASKKKKSKKILQKDDLYCFEQILEAK